MPRLGPRRCLVERQPAHPSVYFLGAIDLASIVNLCVRGERLLDKAANLFLISGVPFDRLNNQTMGRSPGLFGERTEARAQFRR